MSDEVELRWTMWINVFIPIIISKHKMLLSRWRGGSEVIQHINMDSSL